MTAAITINEVQLRYLLGLKCKTWSDIAAIMGISRTCVRDHAYKLGLDNHAMNPSGVRQRVLRGHDHAKALKPGESSLPPLPSLQMAMPVIRGE